LEGKVAIITGGASGIGAAAARLFVSHGAYVAIADVQDALGTALAHELTPRAKFFHCDVTQESDVESLVTATVRDFGRLDIMYSNAGILGPKEGSIQDLDIDAMDNVYAVNLRGALLCTKHAARVMIPQKQGVILVTASVATVLGGVGPLIYSISKTALVGLLKNVSFELAQHGIRVNCISPIGLLTPMSREHFGPAASQMKDDDLAAFISSLAGLKGAVLTPDDIAKAALFLASADAQFISGHNLLVDGGFSAAKAMYVPQQV